mmetsp:Transcript_18959/g.26509  ORF Transcript_18959/g.26509 Transcript_18959/m.26509 type:complete len:207 (-) Transcript_18959:1455-2075(-)
MFSSELQSSWSGFFFTHSGLESCFSRLHLGWNDQQIGLAGCQDPLAICSDINANNRVSKSRKTCLSNWSRVQVLLWLSKGVAAVHSNFSRLRANCHMSSFSCGSARQVWLGGRFVHKGSGINDLLLGQARVDHHHTEVIHSIQHWISSHLGILGLRDNILDFVEFVSFPFLDNIVSVEIQPKDLIFLVWVQHQERLVFFVQHNLAW